MNAQNHTPWGKRIGAEWSTKVALTVTLTVLFCVCYFGLQHVSLSSPRRLPTTWLDHHIPFNANWVWAYLSLYLLMPILPWLATRKDHLRQYLRGLVLLSAISFLLFLLYPVEGPQRPSGDVTHSLYRLVITYDARLNAFPSLHAGLAAYTAMYGYRLLKPDLPRQQMNTYLVAVCVWVGLIFYGTLATKQHWVIDLPAGVGVAWLGHAHAWRGSTNNHTVSAVQTIPREEPLTTGDAS